MSELDPRIPLPDEFSERYWAAAKAGTLLFQSCGACGKHQFYPRRHCRFCLAQDPAWTEAGGEGELYSFTVVHRTPNPGFADSVPYVFALVDLAEGIRITCNVLNADEAQLACGAAVRVVMRELGEWAIPCVELSANS